LREAFHTSTLPLDGLFDHPWVKRHLHLMEPSPFHMGGQFGNDLKEAYKRRPLETRRKEEGRQVKSKVMLMEC